jgi:hypothetical protein
VQEDRGKQRHRERHDPREECSRMRGRSKHQTCVREQDRRTAAEHDRRQPDEAEALESKTLVQDIGQQDQPGHAKAKRGDVPWREAALEAEASDHDPS